MPSNTTPIFPGKIANNQVNIPVSTASTNTIFTADAVYGGLIRGLIIFEKNALVRTCRLELKNGAITTVLKRFAVSGVQYTVTNIFTSTYLVFLNDVDPIFHLEPGDSLQIVMEDTIAAALDVTVLGGTFEYPN